MSWFKNAMVYKLDAENLNLANLIVGLHAQKFVPCGQLEESARGWVAPFGGENMLYSVGQHQHFAAMATEKKLLPASLVADVTRERAIELEAQQGFKPGRKQMRELKEQVIDELLPRAFPIRKQTRVWFDTLNGWLVVDTASTTRADEVFKLLLKTVETVPACALRTERSPLSTMTDWLASADECDRVLPNFTIDLDATLRGTGEGKPTIKYVRSLGDHVRQHIIEGKQCVSLAMTWNDRVSFVLDEALTIKRIEPLDVLKEESNAAFEEGDDQRRNSDLTLMCGELAKLFAGVVDVLGGVNNS
jgi:recombination associated protein RdgC